MNQQGRHTVIIPATLAQASVSLRQVSGRYAKKTGKGYNVATHLHYLSFFCILKSYSPNSGIIRNWTGDEQRLKSISNLSRRAIYAYLHKLHSLGLIRPFSEGDRRKRINSFSLVSWDRLAENFEQPQFKKFISIEYDTDNRDHHPKYILIQAEILHNQQKQAYMVQSKCDRFKRNYARQTGTASKAIRRQMAPKAAADPKMPTRILESWMKLYREKSETGESESDPQGAFESFFRRLNPGVNRGLAGFQKAYAFTDLHRSIYLKRQLEKRGLGKFERGVKVYSPVGNRAPKYQIETPEGKPRLKSMKSIFQIDMRMPGVWLTDQYHPARLAPLQ